MKNETLQDIEDLKAVLDQTIVQLALTCTRLNALHTLLLDVCKETLTNEVYKNLCSNYLSELKKHSEVAIDGLEEVLFDPGDMVLKLKIQNHCDLESLSQALGIADSK